MAAQDAWAHGQHWLRSRSGDPPVLHGPQLIPSACTASRINQSRERWAGSAEQPVGHRVKRRTGKMGKENLGGEVWTLRPEPQQTKARETG